MDRLTRNQFIELAQIREPHCLSLFMPAYSAGQETAQAPIRFKNLLAEAQKLLGQSARAPEVREQLKPAHQLLEDSQFWRYQQGGLAILLTPSRMWCFRVPVALAELVVTGDRFHLLPLMPILASDGRFYVLAFSPNRVRFLACTRDTTDEVRVSNMPQNYEDLGRFIEEQSELQFHTRVHPTPGGAKRAAVFYGHGATSDKAEWKTRLQEYCVSVERATQPMLQEEKAPLVVACDLSLWPIYKQINTYANLLDDGVSGNPDEKSADELRVAGWNLVEAKLAAARQYNLALCEQELGRGRGSTQLPEILTAAHSGRVDTLFVEQDKHIWGRFEPQAASTALHPCAQPGDEDLVDLAAVQTYLNGGAVYVLPTLLPLAPEGVAASYRY